MKLKSILLHAHVALAIVHLNSCRHPESTAVSDLEGSSPIRSTTEGVSLNGTHEVVSDANGPKILRSQTPQTDVDYDQIKALGVSDVLIFKKENRNEVSKEIGIWQAKGISGTHIKTIPMVYANFPDFKTPCLQTIDALNFIHTATSKSGARVLFHCSMGEDRTGYLAGVIQLLEAGPTGSPLQIFKNEMCENGYSAGDPHKSRAVCADIDNDLTPIYLKMAYLIQTGKLSWSKLNPSICNSDPGTDPGFKAVTDFANNGAKFRCAKSSLAN